MDRHLADQLTDGSVKQRDYVLMPCVRIISSWAMPHTTFLAFSSTDPIVSDTIVSACEAARTPDQDFAPWNRNDASGQPIDRSVQSWVGSANALAADISEPNHNVTFEIGLALGLGNPVRLIRAASKDRKQLEEIGLLHNIGPDDYRNRADLTEILRRPFTMPAWPRPRRNREQPVYILQSSRVDDLLRRTTSGIKKIMKVRFRNFSPREIDRLTATEATSRKRCPVWRRSRWDSCASAASSRKSRMLASISWRADHLVARSLRRSGCGE
jgi:hypothetical protein